ncbi:MAG: hypothetical protein WCB80_23885, partial [Mycobacterium sp.]
GEGTDKVMDRIGDPADFRVSPGSSLWGDDKVSMPYQVSHAVRMCRGAGVDECGHLTWPHFGRIDPGAKSLDETQKC